MRRMRSAFLRVTWLAATAGLGALLASGLAGCAEAEVPAPPPPTLERVVEPPATLQKIGRAPGLEPPYEPPCEPIDIPNLRHLDRFDCAIREAVIRYAHGKIAPENIKAEIEVESGGDMRALSPAGALCAMQLLPGTFASMLPRGDIADLEDCVRAGVKYRKWCARFWLEGLRPEDDRWGPLSELCYNAGPGGGLDAQGRCGGYTSGDILPCAPRETRNYVVRIAGLEAGKPRYFWIAGGEN